ncbi:MAG: transposase [Candidatus Thiodiazotropha sp. (ex. Lucinisca nassula)]|nr:transposase [Candidatus Thiodiazotropha sp. (ex. Lucinisca nassula)]MBW9275754.1 transposase [Candidatus Thiodiazotropha sp. (ex. Lucinisca nassula)]
MNRITSDLKVETGLQVILDFLEYHRISASALTVSLVSMTWVHIVIANLKRYLPGTCHGTGRKYLQGYLDEFAYRFNRRFWESVIPNRLLKLCFDNVPMP